MSRVPSQAGPQLFTVKRAFFASIYVYLFKCCPEDDSFDAKMELTSLFRGDHLPQDHPDRPPSEGVDRQSKMALAVDKMQTAMGSNHRVHMHSLAGAVIIATVRCPDIGKNYHRIGMNYGWTYLHSSRLFHPKKKPEKYN